MASKFCEKVADSTITTKRQKKWKYIIKWAAYLCPISCATVNAAVKPRASFTLTPYLELHGVLK